jgi:hypothetical protein
MSGDRLEVNVTFDERGYIGSAPELRQTVVALPPESWAAPSHFHSKQTIDDGRSETPICLNAGNSVT